MSETPTNMKTLLAFFAAIPAIALSAPVYIGTGADGIYFANFDTEKGTLTEPIRAAEYERPGFLALHPEKPVLLAVGGKNKVAAFAIHTDHSLRFLGDADSGGKGPCHLAVDASGRTVAVANYGGGSITTLRLDADGKPGKTATCIKIKGSGPNKKRQNEAHTHGVYFDNSNRFLFVPDLGIDKVLIYRFDPASSEIEANTLDSLVSTPGAGPRHMAFSPDEKHAYIVNELDNTVTAAGFDRSTGALTTIAAVPPFRMISRNIARPQKSRCIPAGNSSTLPTVGTIPSPFSNAIRIPVSSHCFSMQPAAARNPAISKSTRPANGCSVASRRTIPSPSCRSIPIRACSVLHNP